jgi:hypothetical protein
MLADVSTIIGSLDIVFGEMLADLSDQSCRWHRGNRSLRPADDYVRAALLPCDSALTGGTGKFSGIQGLVRTLNTVDPKAGVNEGQTVPKSSSVKSSQVADWPCWMGRASNRNCQLSGLWPLVPCKLYWGLRTRGSCRSRRARHPCAGSSPVGWELTLATVPRSARPLACSACSSRRLVRAPTGISPP